MGSVLNPPRSSATRTPRPKVVIGVVVAIASVALLFSVAQGLVRSQPFVDRVTIVNPTPYHLEVETVGVGRPHGVRLGAVGRERTKTIFDVLDQGREWIFRFTSGHGDGGEIRVSREELVRSDWRVTVPPSIGERLAAAGVAPSGSDPD